MLIRLFIVLALFGGPACAAADQGDQATRDDAAWLTHGLSAYPLWSVPAEANPMDLQVAAPVTVPLSVSYRQDSWLDRVTSWGQSLRLTLWRNSESRLTLGLSSRGLKFRLRGDDQRRFGGEQDQGAHEELLSTQSLFQDAAERTRP